jgi:hypothetical protein
MIVAFKGVLFAVLMLLSSLCCAAKEWRGIIPLRSSRVDVERIIGTPKSKGEFVSSYEFENELVDVYYASGPPCGSGLTNAWKVPRYTVISIRINPKKQTDFDALVTDRAKYRKTKDPTDQTRVYYSDAEQGIRYAVREDGSSVIKDVISVDYLPSSDENRLKCPGTPVASTDAAPFETFGNVSADRQKSILDNFAIQLSEEKQLSGRVLVSSRSARRASTVAHQVRNYLINVRRVERSRLIVRSAKGNAFLVELYLMPSDKKTR